MYLSIDKCKYFTSLLSECNTEAVVRRYSVEKVFFEILQNSQENTCARVSFLINFIKKRLWHCCFSVNLAKFLTKPFL